MLTCVLVGYARYAKLVWCFQQHALVWMLFSFSENRQQKNACALVFL